MSKKILFLISNNMLNIKNKLINHEKLNNHFPSQINDSELTFYKKKLVEIFPDLMLQNQIFELLDFNKEKIILLSKKYSSPEKIYFNAEVQGFLKINHNIIDFETFSKYLEYINEEKIYE